MNPVHELVQNPSTEAQSEGTSVSIWGDLYIAIKLQGRIIDGQATEAFADLSYLNHSPLSSLM